MLYFPSIIIFILKQKQKQCMSENKSGNMKTKKKRTSTLGKFLESTANTTTSLGTERRGPEMM